MNTFNFCLGVFVLMGAADLGISIWHGAPLVGIAVAAIVWGITYAVYRIDKWMAPYFAKWAK